MRKVKTSFCGIGMDYCYHGLARKRPNKLLVAVQATAVIVGVVGLTALMLIL